MQEVSYEQLIDVLWSKIDATQVNGQGNDWGTQYRTGIYYFDDVRKFDTGINSV